MAYLCAACRVVVPVVDGRPVRSCGHDGAPIIGEMTATVLGRARVAAERTEQPKPAEPKTAG